MFGTHLRIVFELFIFLTHFCFNVTSNIIMKRTWNVK